MVDLTFNPLQIYLIYKDPTNKPSAEPTHYPTSKPTTEPTVSPSEVNAYKLLANGHIMLYLCHF